MPGGIFGWLVLTALLGAGGYIFWQFRRRQLLAVAKRAAKRTTLLVIVPKDATPKSNEQPTTFRDYAAKIEPLFSALTSTVELAWEKRLMGQEHFALEIIANKGEIAFYVSGPKHLQTLLEKQLHAHYPDAHIEETFPRLFDKESGAIAATTLEIGGNPLFPIKTYRYLEGDPLNGLTNALSRLPEDSSGVISILIRPTLGGIQKAIQLASRQIQEGKYSGSGTSSKLALGLVAELSKSFVQSKPPSAAETPGQTAKPPTMTPIQEEQLRQLSEKANKPVYETLIRLITVAPDRPTAKSHLANLVSAFGQYSTPHVFFKPSKRFGNEGKIIVDHLLQAFRYGPKLFLNTEELTSLFHLPNQYTTAPNIRWLIARQLSPPVNLPAEGIILGEAFFRGERKLVRLKNDDRVRHVFMLGKTGVGKTTLFINMALQDIVAGKGVCFIDPLGDGIEEILSRIPRERAEDVILFDPGDTERPLGLNLLDWRRPEEKDFLVAEWIEIFYKLYDPQKTGIIGPQWEHWGRNAALTVMSLPGGGTLIDIPRLFTDDAFRQYAISHVTDPVIKSFWEQQLAKTAEFHKSEMYNYFISKFGRFMTNDLMRNIIGQTQSAFSLRQIMDAGKILLVNLAKGKIGETNSQLLGMIFVSKLQAAAFSRADIPEKDRKDFYLYVDEFQNFTTDSFATILSEARKYHLSLNITNQYIAQLTEKIRDAVIGNVGTMIIFRVGAQDAEFLVKEFPGVTQSDFMNLDRYSTYVKLLIEGSPTAPFSMNGGKTNIEPNPSMAGALRQLSRLKYGTDKRVVEAAHEERLSIKEPAAPGVLEALRKGAGL